MIDFVALGTRAVLELIDEEKAVVWPEVEAKLFDRTWTSAGHPIDPHILTLVRARLLADGTLETTVERARGGRAIATVHRPLGSRNKRPIITAAGRKRLLHARYLGWATGTAATGNGVTGPALESVVDASLREASPSGYRLYSDAPRGEIRTLFGAPVPVGPLDNGALLTLFGPAQTVVGLFSVLVEAKNLREAIYPRTPELHQLLEKAGRLQADHPERAFVPVLVCRRVQYRLWAMARQLGFYVIQTKRQYVPSILADTPDRRRLLDEVNDELGYDLVAHDGAVPPMVNHFRSTLQAVTERTSAQWSLSGPALVDMFARLRDPTLKPLTRAAHMEELAELASQIHGEEPTWYPPPDDLDVLAVDVDESDD